MGRPLNKRLLGPPTNNNNEIKVRYHDGVAVVVGWIVKQLGSKRFRCSDGTSTVDCMLVGKIESSLAEKEMSITVMDDGGVPHQAVKIAAKRITTEDGVSIPWNFSNAQDDGALQMEEGGGIGTDHDFINAVDMIDGENYVIVSGYGMTPPETDFTAYGASVNAPDEEFTMIDGPADGDGKVNKGADEFPQV